MIWTLIIILVAMILAWGLLSSTLLLYPRRMPMEANPKTFGFEFERFELRSADGVRLDGWYVPSQNPSNAAIVTLHGWGANRSDVLHHSIFLARHYNLVYFDFRNHGRSDKAKTSLTCAEIQDFKAAVKWLQKEKKQIKTIGVFGFSMGGAVAISGAAEMPEIKAVLAESPFSSYEATIARYAKLFYHLPKWVTPITLFFVRWRLGFDPESCSPIYKVGQLAPRPIFLMQGGSDLRMPVSEGQSLYAAAQEPKSLWTVPDADHGEMVEKAQQEFEKKVTEFFKQELR